MIFKHFGKNYKDLLSKIPEEEYTNLKIVDSDHLLASNPVCNSTSSPVKVAFFGINAYCNDADYSEANQQENFTEWCQENYNSKLKVVINLWLTGLPQEYIENGSVYYSNMSKLVLRESFFKTASDAIYAIDNSPRTKAIFLSAFEEEIESLYKNGCRVFVFFGNDAHKMANSSSSIYSSHFINERHFSYYSVEKTKSLVNSVSKKLI